MTKLENSHVFWLLLLLKPFHGDRIIILFTQGTLVVFLLISTRWMVLNSPLTASHLLTEISYFFPTPSQFPSLCHSYQLNVLSSHPETVGRTEDISIWPLWGVLLCTSMLVRQTHMIKKTTTTNLLPQIQMYWEGLCKNTSSGKGGGFQRLRVLENQQGERHHTRHNSMYLFSRQPGKLTLRLPFHRFQRG